MVLTPRFQTWSSGSPDVRARTGRPNDAFLGTRPRRSAGQGCLPILRSPSAQHAPPPTPHRGLRPRALPGPPRHLPPTGRSLPFPAVPGSSSFLQDLPDGLFLGILVATCSAIGRLPLLLLLPLLSTSSLLYDRRS